MKTRDLVQSVDTLPDFVIASIKKSKWPQPKTQNCYNFGLHVNVCMKLCVEMASYVSNHIKCQEISPGSCVSHH